MDFDWDRTDDTGATEVDPLFAPYIAPQAARVDDGRNGYNNNGRDRENDRSANGRHGQGNRPEDRRTTGPQSVAVQGVAPRIGLFGRGQLAGFDKDVLPGKKR